MTDRKLLRMHIEAVWGISIPPLDGATVELSGNLPLPPWPLYMARLAEDEVTIWRSGISAGERASLLRRTQNADGLRREIVLRYAGIPDVPPVQSQHIARLLTAADNALLEDFEAGSAEYFLDLHRAPCIGVVVAGRLVSVAHSSRRTREACELGINTVPGARRQGYAAIAVRAWTDTIFQEGLTPIYSALAENVASLRLAAVTGYRQVSSSVYGPVRGNAE